MDFEDTLTLVQRAQGDDRVAREELFARYLPRVRVLVAMKLGSRIDRLAEEEDLVQDALLHALRGLQTFRPRSDGTFYAWISTVVANRIRDAWRRSKAAKRDGRRLEPGPSASGLSTGGFGADPGPSPSEQVIGVELGEQLETALLSLDERDREAIVLRELCGLTYPEMAERFALTESSVRSLVTRAKARLAEHLP